MIVWRCRPSHREEGLVKPIYMTHTRCKLFAAHSAVTWKHLRHALFNVAAITLTMLFENLLNRNESMGYSTLKDEQTEVIVNILSGNDVFKFIAAMVVQHVYSRALRKAMTYQPQVHSICTRPSSLCEGRQRQTSNVMVTSWCP